MNPEWTAACVVYANIKNLNGILVKQQSAVTGPYWIVNCDIVIRFGGTELSAHLEWTVNVSSSLFIQ
jgi:hypothetical protein